ncbi:hypothetical protein TRFO_21559 [Tritrichomonas foetus]|uniref:Uncharacterized protein n=1 Tax=Tritrichomonas foetus TaxID=1144522 RepID=A0A1J4KDK2_9EUKA|nr:hypothetical protein TRFO_21559 [Tritrichomonas foetus]|eukprot:OHT09513.1 hypothetical protein TRFO_21559 [Tritrichomonas foetus]
MPILDRDPIRFVPQRPPKKEVLPPPPPPQPRTVKRPRKNVNLTSHEVQTNKEQGQPDANPPEEEVRSGPNVRFDMGNKVPSGTHSPTNEESSQASEPSPNKKKRRTKKNYVDLATDATEENEGMFSPPKSPSKTPPKTPKHRAEMVDSAIETDAAAATPLNSKRTTPSSTPKTPLSPSKRENESIIGGESDQEKDKDKENVNELDKEEPNEDETKENDNKDENKEEMKEEKNEEAKTENEKDEEKRELKDDETETTQSKENEEKKEEDKSSKEQNEKREGDENKRNKISKRRDKSKKYADSETSTNDPEDSTTSTTSIQTTQSKDDNKEKKEHAKLRPKGKKPQLVSQGAGTENENEKKSKENEYEYEYEDEDKPRLVSHGITTDDVECGNADEEDEYEDEVMIVDVYVQTDDVDNDDLVLNVDEMGDMEYMEQYATNPVQNSSISVGSSVYHKYQPPRVFGLEHLLSLSIISEVKASEPQQIVVKIPEATSGEISQNLSRDDISSLIQKALEAQNHTNYNSLKQNIDENTNRIAEIVNTLNQMQGGEPVELINTTQSKEIIENLPKVTGSNIKASNASGSVIYATVPPQPKKIISQLSKPTLSSTPNIILVDCKPLTNPSPSSTDKNNEDKPLKPVVVNYVDNTKSAINNEAVELLKERLDKFELSVSALESQFYDLEKTIINTGAMRPNSAIIDDDKPFSSHLYSRIQHRSPLDGSPVNTKRIIPSDFTITPSKEGSHHKHHKHHSNRSSKIDLAKIQNKLPQQTEQINEEHEKLFDDEPQESEDVALIPFQPSSGNLGEEPTPNQNQGKTYYTQYIPGQQSAQVASEEPKVGLQFIGGFSIDPDFDITQKTQPDTVFDPEDLTISKYERQFRLLREAVVELRTDIQILKVKSNQPPPILPYSENAKTEQKDELETERSIDESTLRNLRRKIDLKLEDYESQISEIRRELYEHLNKPPEKVVEIVKEIHTITKPPEDEKEEVKKEPPPPPKDINVELNLVNAIKMLSDTQHKNIISIHKLELPPEVPEHSNPPTRQPIIEKPPTEQVYKPSANIVHNLPPPTKDVPSNDNENAKPQDFPPIPPPAPTPLMQREPNVGHEVPQIVKDMRVLNAMPKKDMLELLMPFLYELRSELMINIDSNTERIRCIEDQIGQKVEKEFIDTFFRKIRVAVQDADSKATKAINSLVDKITSEDLENRIQELIRQMGAQETTVAGKTNFTCLFCGSKKSTVSKVGGGILDRGKIFKGRATRQSLPTNEASQLPPLSEDE